MCPRRRARPRGRARRLRRTRRAGAVHYGFEPDPCRAACAGAQNSAQSARRFAAPPRAAHRVPRTAPAPRSGGRVCALTRRTSARGGPAGRWPPCAASAAASGARSRLEPPRQSAPQLKPLTCPRSARRSPQAGHPEAAHAARFRFRWRRRDCPPGTWRHWPCPGRSCRPGRNTRRPICRAD